LGRHFIINVVTSDKQNVVQTAKVPQRFIKFLRTFQDMVNMLFCDPKHGNLIAFEAFPAANGFGNEYKMLKQHPMPEDFTGEQIPDLDELLKAATSALVGNLAAPLAAAAPAPAPVATPTSICGISDAEAAALQAKLLAMVGGEASDKARALRPVRP
jgi:hypothetical protein